jgi:hypothetical protein
VKRLGSVLLVLVVLAGGGFALLQVVNARDDANVAGPATGGPGEAFETECPSGSGSVVTRDRRELSQDDERALLARGNVVVRAPRPGDLEALQEEVSGAYDAELAAAGLMVVLAPASDAGVTALAWGRRLVVTSPDDPALAEFADAHLGQGAGNSCD